MDKFVKLMPDYLSDGVWDREGRHMSLDDLPIHFWLKSMIRQWNAEYDNSHAEIENNPFDIEAFSKNGFALAMKIKQNLPDWTVMYFDEAKMFGSNNRDEYVYEITLTDK